MHRHQAPHSGIAMTLSICLHTIYELQFEFKEPSVFLFLPTPCTSFVKKGKNSINSSVLKLPIVKAHYLVKVEYSLGKAIFLIRAMGFP